MTSSSSRVDASGDAARQDLQEIAKYLSAYAYAYAYAYAMFGFAPGRAGVVVKRIHGPGLTTKIPALQINTGLSGLVCGPRTAEPAGGL